MKQYQFGRNFALVAAGQIVSLFGNAILRFALPLFLLRETGSSALFGGVTACSFLPMIALSLVGGVLADRVNKRNIMVALDFSTAVIVAVFSLLLGAFPTIPLFTVTLMLLYGISGTYQPAVQASIPALVSREQVLSANAIANQISSLANFTGPVIGGMLYGVWGIGSILKISIVCFFLSAVMEIFIEIPFQKRPAQNSVLMIVKKDLQDSMQFLKLEKPVFLKMCAVIAGLNLFLSSMLTIGIPVIIVDYLGMSDGRLGVTQGLLAVGGIFGGLLTMLLGKKLLPEKASVFLFLCSGFTFLMGLGMALPGMPFVSYLLLSAMSVGITVSSTMFSIQMLAVVQSETPEHLIGKVIACIMTMILCAQPVGQLLYGVLFERLCGRIPFVMIGTGTVSFGIAVYSGKILRLFGKAKNREPQNHGGKN